VRLAREGKRGGAVEAALQDILCVCLKLGIHVVLALARAGAQLEPHAAPVELLDHRLAHLVDGALLRARHLRRVRGPVGVVEEHFETRVAPRIVAAEDVEDDDARLCSRDSATTLWWR
jgi:hypothetical protein